MTPNALTPEAAAHLETIVWWRNYNDGRALDVGPRGGAPAEPSALEGLASAIGWLALPKQHEDGPHAHASPIEGGQ